MWKKLNPDKDRIDKLGTFWGFFMLTVTVFSIAFVLFKWATN